MKVLKTAVAGTLESSDVMVTIRPNPEKGLKIEIQSVVLTMFGDQIRARVSAAICRAAEIRFNWEGEDCHG